MFVPHSKLSSKQILYSTLLTVFVSLNGWITSQAIALSSTPADDTPQSSITQGIQGRVRRLSGNQMPSNTEQPVSGNIDFVQTTIWIFADRIPGNGAPQWSLAEAEQHPNLVRRVESDRHGHYAVDLPPGEYTVFAQYGDVLYLNAFQADGSYKTTEVVPNQVQELDLTNTENAFF